MLRKRKKLGGGAAMVEAGMSNFGIRPGMTTRERNNYGDSNL